MVRSRLLVVLAVAALCVIGLAGRANVAAPAPAIKWEYKVVLTGGGEKDIADVLNKAGEDGWEMAGVFNQVSGNTGNGGRLFTNGYFIFKRQR